MFGGPRGGTWYLSSKKDPRWNISGRSYVGGGEIPDDAVKAYEEKKKELGEPPDDAIWGYMKD